MSEEDGKVLLEMLALRREFHEHARKVDEQHRQFLQHAAGEDAMRREWQQIASQHAADNAARKQLLEGQDAILTLLEEGGKRMDAMQTELSENTAITAAIRDTSTTFKTLRKWLLWIAPVIAGIGAIVYGVWQFITAWAHRGGGIGPTP